MYKTVFALRRSPHDAHFCSKPQSEERRLIEKPETALNGGAAAQSVDTESLTQTPLAAANDVNDPMVLNAESGTGEETNSTVIRCQIYTMWTNH